MKTLKKRIENLNLYMNSKEYPTSRKKTIRKAENTMTAGRMTQTLDRTRDTRTTNKIKSSI